METSRSDLEKVMKQWKGEAGRMYVPDLVKYDDESGTLFIYTTRPDQIMGFRNNLLTRFTEIIRSLHLRNCTRICIVPVTGVVGRFRNGNNIPDDIENILEGWKYEAVGEDFHNNFPVMVTYEYGNQEMKIYTLDNDRFLGKDLSLFNKYFNLLKEKDHSLLKMTIGDSQFALSPVNKFSL